jgi:hypothetical protein
VVAADDLGHAARVRARELAAGKADLARALAVRVVVGGRGGRERLPRERGRVDDVAERR